MTSVAAAAFEHVLAGSPEKADSYTTADHWWAMLIDIEQVKVDPDRLKEALALPFPATQAAAKK